MSDIRDFLASAAYVVPSARQLDWFEQNFYAFVHFGVNTFTDREWGLGTEDPKIFNPAGLDCDQWARAAKSAGMRGMILTAKHHDGFCLWPSRHTEHSVKNSPFRDGYGDVVRELSDACKRAGLKFGFYLSPWDRNSPLYGTEQYNDYYKAQLTELLTRYGDIFMVWFDGACGEGPNGKRQVYDFQGYIDLIRRYQPNACVFNDAGPDVRWVGNESGKSRFAGVGGGVARACAFGGRTDGAGAAVRGRRARAYIQYPARDRRAFKHTPLRRAVFLPRGDGHVHPSRLVLARERGTACARAACEDVHHLRRRE